MTIQTSVAGNTVQRMWGNQTVSPVVAMWFDQLMALQPLAVSEHADNCYIDVGLSATTHGGSAASPEITFKPAVERGHGRRRY